MIKYIRCRNFRFVFGGAKIRKVIEAVITSTTGNRVVVKSGTRVRIPPTAPKKNELLSTKSSFFFYPSRRLGISSPHKVRCISSAPLGLYLITRQRVFFLRLDEMQHCVLMIYNSFGIDDIQGFALICLQKSSIMLLKGVVIW